MQRPRSNTVDHARAAIQQVDWRSCMPPALHDAITGIAIANNGTAAVVGGSVRDAALGITPKDVDLCVMGVPLQELGDALQRWVPDASINRVGAAFGILKATVDHVTVDIGIPRSDMDRERVVVDHRLPLCEDLKRRDFTCNAIAVDLISNEISGPAGVGDTSGLADLVEHRVIRAVGDPMMRFKEDPLRVLRACQFAARLGLEIDGDTWNAMRVAIPQVIGVAAERFREEFAKGMTKGDAQRFIQVVQDVGLGKALCGPDWAPRAMRTTDPHAAWVALWADGGDYNLVLQSKQDTDIVKAARLLLTAAAAHRDGATGAVLSCGTQLAKVRPWIRSAMAALDQMAHPQATMVRQVMARPIMPRERADVPARSWELPEMASVYLEHAKATGRGIEGPQARLVLQDALMVARQ